MHVHFERSGGFAGITLSCDFDSANLSPEENSDLTRLLTESHFFELPAAMPAQSGADLFQFNITVDNGTQKHSVVFDQKSAPEYLKPLLQWLMAAQRKILAAQKPHS